MAEERKEAPKRPCLPRISIATFRPNEEAVDLALFGPGARPLFDAEGKPVTPQQPKK